MEEAYFRLKRELFRNYPDLELIYNDKMDDLLLKIVKSLFSNGNKKNKIFTDIEYQVLKSHFGAVTGEFSWYCDVSGMVKKSWSDTIKIKNSALHKIYNLLYDRVYVKGQNQDYGEDLYNLPLKNVLFSFSEILLFHLETGGIYTFGDLLNTSYISLKEIEGLTTKDANRIVDYVHKLGYRFIDEIRTKEDFNYLTSLKYFHLSNRARNFLASQHIYNVKDLLDKDLNILTYNRKCSPNIYKELCSLLRKVKILLRENHIKEKQILDGSVPAPSVRKRKTILETHYDALKEKTQLIKLLGKRRSKLQEKDALLDDEINMLLKEVNELKIRMDR